MTKCNLKYYYCYNVTHIDAFTRGNTENNEDLGTLDYLYSLIFSIWIYTWFDTVALPLNFQSSIQYILYYFVSLISNSFQKTIDFYLDISQSFKSQNTLTFEWWTDIKIRLVLKSLIQKIPNHQSPIYCKWLVFIKLHWHLFLLWHLHSSRNALHNLQGYIAVIIQCSFIIFKDICLICINNTYFIILILSLVVEAIKQLETYTEIILKN